MDLRANVPNWKYAGSVEIHVRIHSQREISIYQLLRDFRHSFHVVFVPEQRIFIIVLFIFIFYLNLWGFTKTVH